MLKPGASTQQGFSMKTCLPALMAACVVQRAEAGRRGLDDHVDAAVDRLLVGVQSDEDAVGGRCRPWSVNFSRSGSSRRRLARSSKASATATIFTLSVGVEAVAVAPLPRPPQPIRATLTVAAGRVGRAGEAGKREPGGRGRRALQKRAPRGEFQVTHEKLLVG